MIDLNTIAHHPAIEELTDVLSSKHLGSDKSFFRIIVAYYLGKMAACMRAKIVTKPFGTVPINVYSLALAPSGYGKNTSVNLIEEHVINDFRNSFMNDTMPIFADHHLAKLATERSVRNKTSQTEELKELEKEYARLGHYTFSSAGGTSPAIKQMRERLLLANIGAINLEIDEIGSNLIDSSEALNVFLELYDKGYTKQKLTKNSDTNTRGEELVGSTPANMLLFGEPSKLLDGGAIEDAFYSYLKTGYARRTLFCLGSKPEQDPAQLPDAAVVYNKLCDPVNEATINKWSNIFASLADPAMVEYSVELTDDIGIKLIEYKLLCEQKASKLKSSQNVQQTEIANRYFKALKIAGAFAFVDMSPEITEDHLYQAIKLVEESGSALNKILTRDLPHMKLAKFISEQTHEVTHAEILEELPFFKGATNKKEMISLAKAWGIDHGILITSRFNDDIEFLSGKALKVNDGEHNIVSYSFDLTDGYFNEELSWDNLKGKLPLLQDNNGKPLQWCNHHFACNVNGEGHRCTENVIPKFNLMVFDIDNGVTIPMVKNILQEYSYIIYTTKRHDPVGNHRFRLMLPMSHELELSKEDFHTFMSNILTFLPFQCDEMVKDIVHTWQANPNGIVDWNQGKLFDVLPFIPGSRNNDIYNKQFKENKLANLGALERWFIQKMNIGNRNNYMLRYTMALVDSGKTFEEVENLVKEFNKKLANPLPEEELNNTCLKTAAKKIGGITV